MIIVLGKKITGKVLICISQEGNDSYLCQTDNIKYKILKELTTIDIDVFDHKSMIDLINDLNLLSQELTDVDKKHIGEIIDLAKKCLADDTYCLSFNPFYHDCPPHLLKSTK